MRFSITDENKMNAWAYIDSKLSNNPLYLSHITDYDLEQSATKTFRTMKSDDQFAENLDTWCKKYLTEKQFTALRAALRKKQSRRNLDTFSVEIDRHTYLDLNDLAAADGMTIKDYLSMLIEDRHKEVKPPIAPRAKGRLKL